MADSEMSPKAKVTYDQNKFEVDLNVSEYLPEVTSPSVIVPTHQPSVFGLYLKCDECLYNPEVIKGKQMISQYHWA